MIELVQNNMYYTGGKLTAQPPAKQGSTITAKIIDAHNTSGDSARLKLKFDAMASHDITYVGIIQTARASGLQQFPIPYVLTNCHNSLCAVGGTINEDDHLFGLSAAQKYGGIYVPAHQAVIHSYMREMMSGCGKMILGSDSHTRYGALGTLAIGEGGPELVKQLLCRTYDIGRPEVVAVYLTGAPRPGVGPQDVALAIIGATFQNGFVKNSVMEFIGDGIDALPIEFRNGIDVMTTETACLSSVWRTDSKTERYYKTHGRPQDYKQLDPEEGACYSRAIIVDLSQIENMIALPFHPSNVYTIKELCANARDIFAQQLPELLDTLRPDGKIAAEQGIIAGCAGGIYDNLCAAADILGGHSVGNGAFALSAYPASQSVYMEIIRNGVAARLMSAGITLKTAFCGPCFGAGDVPANKSLSLRHSTRNFPNREGSKPGDGQSAFVALMDARSIAATAANGGVLTPATALGDIYKPYEYHFDDSAYKSRVFFGFGKGDASIELKFGPNIADWPAMPALSEHVVLGVASVITDPVTTTDELIPSGETSSYRSNPIKLASFTLSRKDPAYVGRAQIIADEPLPGPVGDAITGLGFSPASTQVGSVVCAIKPGDGSAREQAASCQRVLGGLANIAQEYATKRYRSNLINWGMLPFLLDEDVPFAPDDYIFVPNVRTLLAVGKTDFPAYLVPTAGNVRPFTLHMQPLTPDETDIILDGCLINYYKSGK